MNPNRRKLIQGTLAAPVVMTVTPALGAAQTSLMACFDNSALKPVNSVAPLASMNQDEWLRVELNVLEVSLPNGKGEVVVQPGRYFAGFDKVSMYKLADVRPESSPAVLVREFNAGTPGLQTRVVEMRRALAYVDRQGNVVGYAWQRRGGSQITASCYASVVGGARKSRML